MKMHIRGETVIERKLKWPAGTKVNFPLVETRSRTAGSVALAENLDAEVSFTINFVIILGECHRH